MAFYDTAWYTSSVAYAAVTARPQNASVAAGVVRRQFTAPAVNSERCFVCTVAGTTANTTDASWSTGRGAKVTDGTATWIECTGMTAVNGDATNTPTWTAAKAIGTPTQGAIIKRANGASYWIASTAGSMGASEPAWPNDTAGTTQADGTTTWTCLGVVGNFPAWSAPHARLNPAYASGWGTAGNKFFIADNHAETQNTGLSLSPPVSLTAGIDITATICVDRTAALPPVEANYNTGATVSITGGFINIDLSASGSGNLYFQGLTFVAGSGGNSSNLFFSKAAVFYFCKNCTFILGTTDATATILPGTTAAANQVLWDNCKVQFGAVGQMLTLQDVNFEWRNTPNAIQGATIPTVLFSIPSRNATYMVCRGVDFSAFPGQLVQNGSNGCTPYVFEDCKFHASMTRYGTSTVSGYASTPVVTVRCDSGATNYKSTRDEFAGSQVTETSITRVGGATDGTTATSDKIVTNSQATFLTPYRMLPLAIWNETIGADVTVTVYGTVNSASLPLNDEIWAEIQYLGSSSSPLASFKSTCKSHPLAAGAAVASDGSTWNGVSTTFATLDGTAVNATLSNGNLTATHSNTSVDSGARSTMVETTGKFYFEVTINNTPTVGDCWGIIQSGASFNGPVSNGTSCSCAYASGNVYSNNTLQGSGLLGSFAAADKVSAAIDLVNGKCWFRKNGGLWNNGGTANPATNTGGFTIQSFGGGYVPFAGFYSGGAGNNVTVNFGSTTFAYTPPSGFGNWSTTWTPFKLVATLTSPQPQMKGFIYVNVRAAKASTTYCIDPLPTLT